MLTALEAQAHAATPAFRRRLAAAAAETEEFCATRRPIVCWSGGKDSTVLAALAESSPTAHVAHFDCGLGFPGVAEFMDRARWAWGRYKTGELLDQLIENGTWDHDAETREYDAAAFWWVSMAGPREEAIEHHAADSMMWGLRADESQRRRMLLAKAPTFRDGELRMEVCCPLRRFTAADIWAAHWALDLEVCPVYERLEQIGCPERAQRLDVMVGSDGAEFGRFHWLKVGWPDQFNKLAADLPRIREWA